MFEKAFWEIGFDGCHATDRKALLLLVFFGWMAQISKPSVLRLHACM
jgi:hypothetical protein